MVSPPPIPRRFTKQFQQQEKQKRERAQAEAQHQAEQLALQQAQQQSQQQQLFEAQQKQVELYKKLNSGNASFEEFKRVQNYPLGERDRSAEDYINYLSSHGKEVPQKYFDMLPETGRSYRGAIVSNKNPNGIQQVGQNLPTQLPSQQPFFVSGQPAIGGYTSTTGQSVVYISKSPAVTQFPASFQPAPQISSQVPTNQFTPAEYLPSSFVVGGVEGAKFTEVKQEIKQKVEPPQQEKNVPSPEFLRYRLLYNPTVVEGSRKVIEYASGANIILENIVGGFGQKAGSAAYQAELFQARRQYESPEGFYFTQNVFKKRGEKFETTEQIKGKAKTKLSELESPYAKIAYQEIGASTALQAQYIVFTPSFAITKSALSAATDIRQNRPEAAVFSFATGIAFKGAEKVAESAFIRAAKPFSKVYAVEYGSGFKNIVTEKFVSKRVGIPSTLISNELIPLARKTVQAGAVSYVGSGFLTGIDQIRYDALGGKKQSAIREESVIASRETGYFVSGYSTPTKIAGVFQPFYYQAKFSNRVNVPFEKLQAKDVARGDTIYSKDIMNARAYKKKIETKMVNPEFKFQAEYFNQKFFDKQASAFNVSQAGLPERYYPSPGTSEYSGQFFNPFNPAFTFGIPKEGISPRSFIPSAINISEVGGAPSAEFLYGKGVKLFNVAGKGFESTAKAPAGFFIIPTKGKLRSKSESEVLVSPITKIIKTDSRYYTIEKNLSIKRGFPFGVYFEIPEYRVSFYQGGKAKTATLSPASVERVLGKSKSRTEELYRDKVPLIALNEAGSRSEGISSPRIISYARSSGSRASYGVSSGVSTGSSSGESVSRSSYSLSSSFRETPSRVSYSYSSPFSREEYRSQQASSYMYESYEPSLPRSPPSRPSSSVPRITSRPPRPPFSPIDKQVSKTKEKVFSRAFKIISKTKGKPFELRERYTYSDAVATATNLIANTLRASFKVEPAEGIASPRGVRAANVQGYLNPQGFFVQRRGTRLASIGERLEIKQAARNRLKKSKRVYYGI